MSTPPARSPDISPTRPASDEVCHLSTQKRSVELGPALPDSSHHVQAPLRSNYFQRLSAAGDEISETALGEGFSFGLKKPARPGQFSERPHCQPSVAIEETHESHLSERPKICASGSGVQTQGSVTIPRGPPLSLHELCLPTSRHVSPIPLRKASRQPTPPVTNHLEAVHTPPAKVASRPPSEELPSSAPASRKFGQPTSALGHREEAGHAILCNLLPDFPPAKEVRDSHLTKGPKEKATVDIHYHNGRHELPNDSPRQDPSIDLKTPGGYALGTDHVQRRSSPSSTCGDLERPVHPSPEKPRHSTAHRPAQLRASSHRYTLPRHRSDSRASNVSKKRTNAHKPHLRPDPERKMLAMHQVAQYWNECIQIAEDERNQANWEIEHLQHRLQRQDLKLSESHSLLSKKQLELEDAERHCHRLQENDSHMASENQRLSGEVETLRGQLSESQLRATELRNRQRQVRDKLNEAVQEQQDLYKRSRAFYEDSMSALRKENEQRVADSTKIDEALEKGRQKREEMMRCLQELRDTMDRENRLKEETINELRRRIEEQEDSIRHERGITETLRQQIELQEVTQHTIEGLASQVESLVQSCTEKTHDEQRNASIMDHIIDRLDALAQNVQVAEGNNFALTALRHAVQDIGDVISTHVVSAVADVAGNQQRVEQTILKFGFTCGGELTDIKRLLKDQTDNRAASQALEEEDKHQLRDALESIESRLRTAQDTFQRVELSLEERVQQELRFRDDEIKRRQANLDTKLAGRDERVSHLEQQLQLISESYAAKVDALTCDRSCSNEAVQEAIHKVFAEFRTDLEKGFLQEKERSEGHLRQNQTALVALESQLRAVNDHLTIAKGNDLHEGAEGNVYEENALVSKLQDQVRDLEKQAKAAEELHGRWRRDIQTVDALRAQLKEIQSRVPQMERFDTTLGKMTRMNEILHSTAQYLTHERHWARQHLEKMEVTDGRSDGHSVDGANTQPRETQQPTIDRLVTSIELESLPALGNADTITDEDFVLEEAPFFRRKVTVYSPAGVVLSPSPPPSIHQEQVRRRGAAQPRSILKLSTASTQDSTKLQEQAMRINQSQYNRPVVGRDSTVAASAVVEQIRAELVPSERLHLAWSLPTVADFERDGRFASTDDSQRSGDGSKRRLQCTDDVPGVGGKRAKLDADTSVTESRG